jgi:subtilisin-like proprotein convertase family protein
VNRIALTSVLHTMKHHAWLAILPLISSTFAGNIPTVGSRYVIDDAGQQRVLVISSKGLALRPQGGSLRPKLLAGPVNAKNIREQFRRERLAQPNLAEVNFLLEEPAVQGRKAGGATPLVLTCQVHVTLPPGTDVDALAQSVGVTRVDKPAYAPNQYVFHSADEGGSLVLMEMLRNLPAVTSANAMLARSMRKRFTPNDPLYAYNASVEGYQWHLKNTGQRSGTANLDLNITTAWDTVRGTGIVIGVVDDGVEITHPDLAANYLASASWDFRDNDSDPSPVDVDDEHGTSVAGLAVAVGNNSVGVSGTAPSAKFAGIRIDLNTTPDSQVADALAYKNDVIHIKSNSYGPLDTGTSLEGIGPLTEAAILDGATNGRAGRGTIYMVAAGNGAMEGDNSNYDGFANSIYTIAVAGASDDGTPTGFSEPGANIVISALGDNEDDQAVTTTDRSGALGYNKGDPNDFDFANTAYTAYFGGTSACTPEAAGVVALMLQTKSTLGWRDVQEILMSSATKNHAADYDWSTNAAGFNFNHKYGAGLLNATAAVTMANTWVNLGTQTSVSIANPSVNAAIPDYAAVPTGVETTFNFATQPILRVEHVTVMVDLTHPARGELDLILTSPSGMTSRLAERHDDLTPNYEWTFMSVRHWGENSSGTWKLRVIDREKVNVGTLVGATVKLYGTSATAPVGAPVVTSAATASGMVNVPFSYQITATSAPTSFSTAAALPAGLTLNTTTGLISGTPTTAATSSINLRATNGSGTSVNKLLSLTVSATAGLATGTDNLRSNWVTGGTATWALNTTAANAHDGVDSVKPAALAIGGYTHLKTWVDGPALLKFWWKSNSLHPADSLSFYLDGGSPMNSLSTATTYAEDYYFIPAGRHSIRWEMYRDPASTIAGTNSTGYVDQVSLVDPYTIAPYILRQPSNVFAQEGGTTCFTQAVIGQAPLTFQWKRAGVNVALNGTVEDLLVQPVPAGNSTYTCTTSNGVGSITTTPASLTITSAVTAAALANGVDSTLLNFGTNASLGWARQTTVTHDGSDALKSGAITDNGSSLIQTCVVGPATVHFWWRVSSENGYDFLDAYVDDSLFDSITGESGWLENEVFVGSGPHLIEWNYFKDDSDVDPTGADAGYLDSISVIAHGFDSWKTQQFSIAQQNATSISGKLDDPDKDGIPNLVEFALGLNPNQNTQAGLPVPVRVGNNLEYTYVDDYDRDVFLFPETSTTLNGTWTHVEPTEVSVSGELHTMKVTLPLGTDKIFLRLRVEEF